MRRAPFFGEVIDAIETARPVTIAAIQGGAYGGGTDLCLACDFRVGTHDANIFMPAARFGLHFYPGGIRRYLSRLGLNSSKRLFLTAERLESEEMLRIGFLTELVSAEDLHQRLDHLSEELAMMAPLALLGIKRDLNAMVRGDFDILKNNDLVLQSERSNDLKEAVTAWREQRKPHFIGK